MNIVLVFIVWLTIFVCVPNSYFHFFGIQYWRWFVTCFLQFKQFFTKFFMNLLLQFYIDSRFCFYFHSAYRTIIMLGVSVLMQTCLTKTMSAQKLAWLKHKCETNWALSVYLFIISSTKDEICFQMIAFLMISYRFGFHDSTSLYFWFKIIVSQCRLGRHETRTVGCLIVMLQWELNHRIQIYFI